LLIGKKAPLKNLIEEKTINIYVLELEEGKYYVGASKDPTERFRARHDPRGSIWTKLYPAVTLIGISPFEEDKVVKRGLEGATRKCFRCGQSSR
jgi:hypothetical protein